MTNQLRHEVRVIDSVVAHHGKIDPVVADVLIDLHSYSDEWAYIYIGDEKWFYDGYSLRATDIPVGNHKTVKYTADGTYCGGSEQ